jgi:HSP20 family protein
MTTEIQQRETRVDPWTDFDRAFDELREHFLSSFGFASPFAGPAAPADARAAPIFRAARADVTDAGKSYKIVAEIPGIPKDQLDVRVRGSSVEIRGEQARDTEETKQQYVYRERTYSGYYRRVELPEPVVASKVTAKLDNGLLELELPKQHPEPTPEEVKVAVQ